MTEPTREEVIAALLLTAKMLLQNARGCASNHYGHDFESQGTPGWLRDAEKSIVAADRALTRAGGKGEAVVEIPQSDANDLDDVVRELGIESSHVTPAEAVRALYAERDDWSQRYATLAKAAAALLATEPDERQNPAVWFERVDAVKAALLPAQTSSDEGGR